MKNIFKIILIFFILLVTAKITYPENRGAWVEYQWHKEIANSWHKKVGGNCVIWVDDDSGTVIAFDNHSHRWHEYNANTQLPWNHDVKAGEDVAIVWYDSLVVVFNALNHTFHELTYEGSLKNNVDGYGCIKSAVWFLTDKKLYVFDSEDNNWHNIVYTKPDNDENYILWAQFKEDYLLFDLESSINTSNHQLLTYSLITKIFKQFTTNVQPNTILDKGFTFIYNDGPVTAHYFGGYSAVTAEFTTFTPGAAFLPIGNSLDASSIFPQTVSSFYSFVPKAPPVYTANLYCYNTETGEFNSTAFDFMYAGNDGLNIRTMYSGCNLTTISIWNRGGDGRIGYIVYSGITGAFSSFTSDLIRTSANATSGPICGKDVFGDFDGNNFIGYNIASQSVVYTGIPSPPPGSNHHQILRSGNNWAADFCKLVNKDTVIISVYNGYTNTTKQLTVNSDLSYNPIINPNILGFESHVNGEYPEIIIFTPGDNSFHQQLLSSGPAVLDRRDCIEVFSANDQLITLYDGITGSIYQFNFGRSINYFDDSHYNYFTDNFTVLCTGDDSNIGYSTFTHTEVTYQDGNDHWLSSHGAVALSDNHDKILAYNALYNCFTPLIKTDDLGAIRSMWPGDSTGIVITSSGKIFAYDPYLATTSVGDENNSLNVPEKFKLFQNYPNPFNPTTTIKYSIPRSTEYYSVQQTTLKVYDILGREVATLVNKEQKPGNYEIKFNADDFGSGIYFYRLQSGSFTQSRKMILLK